MEYTPIQACVKHAPADHMVGLRLTEAEHAALKRYAEADSRKIAQLARLMVQNALTVLEQAARGGRSPAEAVAAWKCQGA